MAASSDPEDEAHKTVELLELSYSVLYGLDAKAVSAKVGCSVGTHEGRPHIQPMSFILRPDGTVELAVYSTGKVGRLSAGDALEILRGKVGQEE